MNWRRAAELAAIAIATAVLLGLSLQWLSYELAKSDLDHAEVDGQPPTTADRLEAIDEARGRVLQAALGVSVLLTAFVAWRRYRAGQVQLALAQKQYLLSEESAIDSRVSSAIELLGSESKEVVAAAVVVLGSVMLRRVKSGDSGALDLAALLSNIAVSASRSSNDRSPSGCAPPPVVQSVLRAFGELPPDSHVVLNLGGADLSHWSIDLPSQTEVFIRGANVSDATFRGFETYVRITEAELQKMGVEAADGLSYDS